MSRHRWALVLVEDVEADLSMAEALARLGRWAAAVGLLAWRLTRADLRLTLRGAQVAGQMLARRS